MRYVSLDSSDGGSRDVVAEDTKGRHSLLVILEFRSTGDAIAYRVVNRIAMAKLCREDWVDELVHPLEGAEVWVDPR
jgi:hypothetical protein